MKKLNANEVSRMVAAGVRPADMQYREYVSLMKSARKRYVDPSTFAKAQEAGDDDEEEEEEEEEEDEEEDEEDAAKSFRVSAARLEKSIEAFDDLTAATDDGRMEFLLGRQTAGTISKSERLELSRLIAGDDSEPSEPIRKSMVDRIEEHNHEAGRAVRVNEFLKSLTETLDDSLTQMTDRIQSDNAANRAQMHAQVEMIKSLAGTVVALGHMVDEMTGRLHVVERTPVAPRAAGHVDPRAVRTRDLNKSGASREDRGEQLSKSQVLRGLRGLTAEASAANDSERVKQLAHATAKYESTMMIDPRVEAAVRAHLNG